MNDESDYLLISGIQHFEFCKRQWALIHIENIWTENVHTISGNLMHTRAHNSALTEKRGDLITVRDMPIVSHNMGIVGKCDVVEFYKDDAGVTLFGRSELWLPRPVEYKRGKPKSHDADNLQLCAQAMCMEEMLLCKQLDVAYLYYGEIKHRHEVVLDEKLREKVRTAFLEMRGYYLRGYTPRVKYHKGCVACSLKDNCLPKLPQNAGLYIKRMLNEGGSDA